MKGITKLKEGKVVNDQRSLDINNQVVKKLSLVPGNTQGFVSIFDSNTP